MGSQSSKAIGPAARTGSAKIRQYPAQAARPPPPIAKNNTPGTTLSRNEQAQEAIHADGRDAEFAASLRKLGAVQPNPTYSPSATFNAAAQAQGISLPARRRTVPDPRTNPAVTLLEARQKAQEAAEAEFMEAGRPGHQGRVFLDVGLVRQLLDLRDNKGLPSREIESRLRLRTGLVEQLGVPGLVGPVNPTST